MIVGFNFNKINIERKKKLVKGMKVKYNMDITKVSEQDYPAPSPQQGILNFDFNFTVGYGENIADLAIHGTVSYMIPKEEMKKVMELWNKTKKLPKEISVPIINLILDRSNIKALELEQDLSLPTHLPMPSVNVDQKKDEGAEQYIG
tara:strand:+ start:433 stop:873 length:441 start_codon:yes stop_codon:yes gene_type:complete